MKTATSEQPTLELDQRVLEASDYLRTCLRIPELDFPIKARYAIASEQEVLHPIIHNNDVIAIVGAFYGDEGKGKLIDAVAHHPLIQLIMRANGGENAGHTVFLNGVEYIFHLTPSAILVPDKTCLIGQNCEIDPLTFMPDEIQPLQKEGISLDKLFIGNAHIVTPYHKLMDLIGNPKNTSTLRGMGPSHASKAARKGLRLNDLYLSEKEQACYLLEDMRSYEGLLHTLSISESELIDRCRELNTSFKRIPDHVIQFLREKDKVSFLIDLYQKTVTTNSDFPKQVNSTQLLNETLEQGKKVLLEGSQARMLSNAEGTCWRKSTSADTTAAGLIAAAGYNPTKYGTAVINVAKFPSSKVGAGPNPTAYVPQNFFSSRNVETLDDIVDVCDDFDAIQKKFFESIRDNGTIFESTYTDNDGRTYAISAAMAIASSRHHKERGATTKKPRITGLFDCVVHHSVNQAQGPLLAINALDRGDDYDNVGITIAYIVYSPEGELTADGRTYKTGDIIKAGQPLPNETVLSKCYKIMRVLPGWKKTPLKNLKPTDPLPPEAEHYIGAIKLYTGADPISMGTGTGNKDIHYLKRTN